ncbi:membrane protein insertase YidC [Weissella diestrammenae]|uniref:Membrane protein insertase YidC n=1 Tax=Weissella diestrammenae TaxID=1162633 RepID=A0A7G9T5D3_9LACO|nr:membrane protein insertase YidC [Weissella diestrammenae]MCM0583168.1 membrane protein insertase YidC [Weissella diestrammenae]QNN75308.1 membrane protein insertase YidC [Weissella diestrammenae]
MKIKGLTPILLIILVILFFTGHIYFLSPYLAHFMNAVGDMLKDTNAIGWSILILTFVVRLVLLPMQLHQSRNMTIQQEKMRLLQPQLTKVQEAQKNAETQEDKMNASQAMMHIYRENGVSMLGGMNFSTLIIQWPIFSGLYAAINPHIIGGWKHMDWAVNQAAEIKDASFFGIQLAQHSLGLAIATGLVYLAQSYLSMIGMPEEQKKQMQTMSLMMPIMMFAMTYFTNAGVGLYFFGGAIIMILQTLVINYWRPYLRKQVGESFTVKDVVDDALAGKIKAPEATGFMAKMAEAQQEAAKQQTTVKDVTPDGQTSADKLSNRERNRGIQQNKKD